MSNKILYHGTTLSFVPPFKNEPTFFVGNYDFAFNHLSTTTEGKTFVIKCEMDFDSMTIFDPRKSGHRTLLFDSLPDSIKMKVYGTTLELDAYFLARQLDLFTDDVWRYMEDNKVMSVVMNLGFDGHIAKEDGEVTYCIYEPNEHAKDVVYLEELSWKEYSNKY